MKKITIPENTRVIIDGDVIIFEPATPKELEVGKWYKKGELSKVVVLVTDEGFVGVNDGEWICNIGSVPKGYKWQPADMKEVEKILIKEAEKIGFKKGVEYKFTDVLVTKRKIVGNLSLSEYTGNLIDEDGNIIFLASKGKWAEIIPEKKPLYTNAYGTVLREDDLFSWVHSSLGIKQDDIFDHNTKITDSVIFIGTTRECHQYLADNWDELNKNK